MPVLIDDLLNLSKKELREWNYFNHEGISSGVISWSRGEKQTASIGISVDMVQDVVKLSYVRIRNWFNQRFMLNK